MKNLNGTKRNKLNRLFAGFFAAALALPAMGGTTDIGPIRQHNAPDPGAVVIRNIIYAGSGCPAGSVAGNVSLDNMAFTLLFDSFVAEGGPGLPLSATRKNCTLSIDLQCPAGWSFTLMDLDTRGYAQFDPEASGLQKTSYYFQGSTQTGSFVHPFSGPFDDDYVAHDELAIESTPWGSCSQHRALNVNSQVRVTAPGSSRALMTVDSIDGQTAFTLGLSWRRDF